MQAMTETMKVMKESLLRPTAKASLPLTAPLSSSSLTAGPSHGWARPSTKSAAPGAPVYPGLDAGVVQSALAAGVGHKALEEMASLLSANPARRLKETRTARPVTENPLERAARRMPWRSGRKPAAVV